VLEYLRPEPPGWAFTGSEFLLHLSVRPPPRGREGESRSLCGTMFGSGGCSTAWLPRNGWSRSPKTARHLTPDRAPERRPTGTSSAPAQCGLPTMARSPTRRATSAGSRNACGTDGGKRCATLPAGQPRSGAPAAINPAYLPRRPLARARCRSAPKASAKPEASSHARVTTMGTRLRG
jgi:hypothetical protein